MNRHSLNTTFVTSVLSVLLGFGISSKLLAGAGTTTGDILKINQGARPAGMAGVYTALGDDGYSVNYNPAGLASLKGSEAILLHLSSLADISYEYFTFATPVGNDSALAANFTYRYSPPIDNQNGNPPVTADDLLGSLSYGLQFSGSFRGGITFKYLKSDLYVFSASAVAVDLGVQLDNLPWGLKAGLAVQNLGTGMSFTQPSSTSSSTTSASLPMYLRLGVGMHQLIDPKVDPVTGKQSGKDLNIGIEIFRPNDQDTYNPVRLSIGAEYWAFPGLFAVRGGYKIDDISPYGGFLAGPPPSGPYNTPLPAAPATADAFQNYTLGFTLYQKIESDEFSFDVAYNPGNFVSTTEATFFFALNFKFNQLRIF